MVFISLIFSLHFLDLFDLFDCCCNRAFMAVASVLLLGCILAFDTTRRLIFLFCIIQFSCLLLSHRYCIALFLLNSPSLYWILTYSL